MVSMPAYTLWTDFSSLSGREGSDWLGDLYRMAEDAFRDSDDKHRLLGNLLVLERYRNTVCQGLAKRGEELSPVLLQGTGLLWDHLEGRIEPASFQDFANSLEGCVFAQNVGTSDDAPPDFYHKFFAGRSLTGYEWLAVEWVSGLLIQLVYLAGGTVEDPDFGEIDWLDFYGVCDMMNILEDACTQLTGVPARSHLVGDCLTALEQVHQAPLFQQMVADVQGDLKAALSAPPDRYAALREEYRQHTILPAGYAPRLLEY